ncbi:TetR family transcriptional regulator [Leifsonia sp. Root4]|uniref:TetR/AcrR family transcriptional regulator n=1 Tax=Leifsonia sp. Root4 TaxID=1736525 RepID=UPI0006F85BFE|nr:TetR/AcrR family transcriptional regulator [Leifsonia sp. Root4]KQW04902.1 TetR family transcriptional regulator [Leifsonia sp. Root4]
MARRGSYAKGVAKREEILTEALQVIAQNGYSRASVRELADAVGLSQAGLLHYFSSKEELFTAVLQKRDEVDAAVYLDGNDLEALSGLAAVMRHNTEVPGLAQLYSRLSAEATDPAHPAHDFFVQRTAQFRAMFADNVRARQQLGTLPAHLDPDKVATIMIALADGLQTQWTLDPSIDMAEHIDYLAGLLSLSASGTPAAE